MRPLKNFPTSIESLQERSYRRSAEQKFQGKGHFHGISPRHSHCTSWVLLKNSENFGIPEYSHSLKVPLGITEKKKKKLDKEGSVRVYDCKSAVIFWAQANTQLHLVSLKKHTSLRSWTETFTTKCAKRKSEWFIVWFPNGSHKERQGSVDVIGIFFYKLSRNVLWYHPNVPRVSWIFLDSHPITSPYPLKNSKSWLSGNVLGKLQGNFFF